MATSTTSEINNTINMNRASSNSDIPEKADNSILAKVERNLRQRARKLFTFLIIALFPTISLFSQTFMDPDNPATNFYRITFTDEAQSKLVIIFNKNVPLGLNISQLGWSVTGTAASILQIDAAGKSVQITLTDSITFAEKSNVKVSYVAATGNFLMSDATEPDFVDIPAFNNWRPVEADFSTSTYGEIPPVDICSPVKDVVMESNIIVGPRLRNSIHYRFPRVYLTWIAGNDLTKSQKAYTENAPIGSGSYTVTVLMTDGPNGLPTGYSSATSNCTWKITMFPYMQDGFSSVFLFVSSLLKTETIPNYKLDNGTPAVGTGVLGINPITDAVPTLFCVGSTINNFIFNDVTTFNCNSTIELELPNIRPRFVQYVYSTQLTRGIPNTGLIRAPGDTVWITDNSGNAIPFEGPVTNYLFDNTSKLLITPRATTYPIYHKGSFVTDIAGDVVEVTMRYWGPCNVYDGTPFAFINAVTTTSRLRLIPTPPIPTVLDIDICEGGVAADRTFHVTSIPIGPLNWYAQDPVLFPATPIVFTGANFVAPVIPAGTQKDYWVVDGGVNNGGVTCKSPAKKVTLKIRNGITNNTISVDQTICFNTTPPTGLTGLLPVGGDGTYVYQWRISTTSAVAGFNDIPGVAAQNQNYTIPGNLTQDTWYRRRVTSVNCSDDGNAVKITVTPLNTAGAPSATPNICINIALTAITHATTGATGIGAPVNLPAGVTAAWAANVITISGTPTASGTFNYTIPLTGGCGTVNASGTITVRPNNTVGAASSTPTLCISTVLTNITHATTGATGIGAATGLPTGVTAAWAANVITISGTPTASGTFNYSIPLTGGCGTFNATGTITVTPNNTAGAASSSPNLCISTLMTNITHTTTGATGIGAPVNLPAGVTAAWAANVITISGTPTASGTFNYTIPLTGGCGAINATGTITVRANNTAGAASSSPNLCISTLMTNITHATTGATGIGAPVNLPAGVTAAWAANVITISGTPTASGTFNYTIPLTGGCSAVNATGTITVRPNNTAGAASSSPNLCISTLMTNITHATTGATGIGAPVNLPAGVTAAWAANVITISGTPTASGTFNYTIPLTGGCGAINATGTITVRANNTAGAASSSPNICISTLMTNVTHATTGATGIGAPVNLPAGVTAAWAANVITISGTPTASGTFNYTIPLTGGCSAVNATGTITVRPNNTAGAASSTPTLCINTLLTNITHATTGATGIGAPVNLPAGVTAAWAANVITISGTPTAAGVFGYTIPLTGGCGAVNATGTITVSQNATASAGPVMAAICQGGTSAVLGGTIGGQAVSGTWSSPQGGTFLPTVNTLNATWTPPPAYNGTATLTLTPAGGTCAAVPDSKTIVVLPGIPDQPTISGPTPVCQSITGQVYSAPVDAKATSYQWTFAPALNVSFPGATTNRTITVDFSPTSVTGNVTVIAKNSCGDSPASPAFTITVTPTNTAGAPSSTPTLCISTPLINITHATTGATGIGAPVNLPAGVTAAWAANVITISGTPTAAGTFNYTIPLTGGCGTVNAAGTITVTPNNTAGAASSSPNLCISTLMTNITHATTGATGIGAPVNLPAGVTAAWAANVITISGTPTASGTFNYTIPLTGGCGALNATGTITVRPNNTAGVASSTPTLCISTLMTNITHATTGATGIGAPVNLPAGVTAAWAANVITISGTPTASGTFNYTIPLTGGCGAINAAGTITVTPNMTAGAASSSPNICISTLMPNITHATTLATGIGAPVNLPAGVTAAWAANVITISGTPTASGTFNYTIPLTGGCGAINASGTITVRPNNTAGVASSTPTLCINTALTNITHATTGATGIGVPVNLPAGVTAAWAANVITISGIPTASGTFNYTIPLTGGCGAIDATGTITVTPNNTAGAASSTPTLCISTLLTNITHATTGATGIAAPVNLPAGVTAAWAANVITISGTPTASGTFNYTIPLTGGCGTINAAGTITVTPNMTAGAASSSPNICINTLMPNITHATTLATGIGVPVNLPAGVTAAWAANVITISGTPTASGTFNYTIPLTGGCGAINASGTITVRPNNTVGVPSSTPTLCINTLLTNITHATTGATGIGAPVGLPVGVTAAWAANTITISGTPTVSGTFNYTIPLTGGCGAVNATGTITVIMANTASAGSSTPTLCINTVLTNITHTTTGATGIGAPVNLPAGVTASWAANVITISGTPTASGTFNYTIPLNGGCGTVNATGTITVTPDMTVGAASSSPTLCISTALVPITHATTLATGIGAAVGLPAGVSAVYAANTITISGTPTASGTFNYSIPLLGGCGTVNATGTITVTPNMTASAPSTTPSLCISTPLTAITHTTTLATGITNGGVPGANGLPAGVSASWAAGTITISGTPTASGTFNYTIPLTGGCGAINATGTITVQPNNTITLTSAVGTDAQVVCLNSAITAITYSTTGATGATITGLPAGVTGSWAANVVTISGSPSTFVGSPFSFIVTLTGGCGTAVKVGTLTVNPLPITNIPLPQDAIICQGTANKSYQADDHLGSTWYTWSVPGNLFKAFDANLYFILINAVAPGNGNITVFETDKITGCVGLTQTFNITVSPTIPGAPVAGPATICRNDSAVYSVPYIAGSSYSWTLPPGAFIALYPDSSAVTVTFPLATTGGVSVFETNGACTKFHPATSVTVNPLPVPTIAGVVSACVTSTGNVYSTEAGMSAYIWTVSGGGTISGGTGTNTITVDWNTAGAQNVSVTYTNASGCKASAPTVKNVTVYPLPVPTISGAAAACLNSTGNIYTTEASMSGYTWTVSGGGTIVAGAGTNAITVTWNATGAQSVSVNYTNTFSCAAAAPTVKNITVNALPTPALAGPAAPCVNSTGNVYTTDPLMTNYIWSVSAGGVITAGGTGNETVTVTWTTTGAKTVTVNYTNGAGCTAATPTSYAVTVNPLPVPVITGPAAACVTSTGNKYKTAAGMTNYIWTVSPGGSISAGGTNTADSVVVTWNTAGAQTVSVNYTNGAGCTAAGPTAYNVTVNPLPVPTIVGNGAACLNSTGNVYTTESGMTNYIWVVSGGGTTTAGGTVTDNSVTVTWTGTGAQTVSVVYTNGAGCTAAGATVKNITVNTLPVPVITGPNPVCRNSTGNVYSTDAGMTSYIWSVSAGGIITAGGTGNQTVTVTWTTSGPQSVSVNYTNANSCTAAAPTVYPVTVNVLPVPVITGPAAACITSIGNKYKTATGMTNYTWTVSPGGLITAGGTLTADSVVVTWNTTGPQTVTVNYTDGNSCTATTPTAYSVTVNPLPVPTITGANTACVASTGNIYSTEAGMSAYTWILSAGGTITAGAGTDAITVTWNTAGAQNVSVNYTNANLCTAAAATVKGITVNPLPVPTIGGNASVCLNSVGNVYTTEAGMSNYIWTVSAGGTITGGGGVNNNQVIVTWTTLGAQTVSVNYSNVNNCTAAAATVYNVTVNALPAPTILGPTPVCATVPGNVYTTQAGMTNYLWTVSAGGTITAGGTVTDNTVTVTWTTSGAKTVRVNYTNADGCTAAIATTYNVTVNPLPVPTIGGPAAVCVNSTGNLYLTEAGMTNYTWAVSAGGTITGGGTPTDNTVTVTWTTTGVKTVSVIYTNGNGCTNTAATVYNVLVNPLPIPTISGSAAACVASTANIYTTEGGMTGYTWSVSAGGTITAGGTATDNTATITWTAAGAQTVSVNYINGTGCTAAAPTVKPVTVNPLPVPAITGPASACITTTANVYTTEPAMGGYTWTISGGGTITAGAGTNAVTVTWNTAGPQSVSVNYTNLNGCTAAAATVYPVTVNPLPVITVAGPATPCVNSTGNVYTSQAGMSGYIWNVSAGGVITAGGTGNETVTVTWTATGAQTVSVNYTNGNGCTAASAKVYNVTVNPLPVPTITGAAAACVTSTGNSYSTEAGMSGYLWTVSAGGTIMTGAGTNSITVDWNTAGAQTVSVNYTNANFCTAATPSVKAVTVNPLPVPTITGNAAACVTSTGNAYSTEAGMSLYTWSVSAGGTITGGAGTNTIAVTWNATGPQTVSVNYTNGNSCTAAAPTVKNITINPLPVVTISGNASVCLNSTGNVYTTEALMSNYVWSVSPGGVITAGGTGNQTVTVTWTTTGVRTVSVNYTNGDGCTATLPTVYNVTVNPLPLPTITGAAAACVTSTGNVYFTEGGMSGYLWTVSAGGTITAGAGTSSITVDWNTAGAQTITVNYTNANSCTAATPTAKAVTVNPLPVPTITGNGAACITSINNLYTTEAGMSAYNWIVSAGGTITGGVGTNSIAVTWNTAGPQSVSVNYTNGNSCTAAAPTVKNITVNPLPVPALAGPNPVCNNTAGNVYTTDGGMSNYTWLVSAGGTITAGGAGSNTVTVTWNLAGPQTVSVNYTNTNGCTAAAPTVYPVTVNALPVPTISGPAAACLNSTANTYTTEAGMSAYLWTVSAGGAITAGAGTNAITVTWSTTGPKTVGVNYTNASSCTALSPTTYSVTVNPLPVPSITGPAAACVTSVGNVYSTEPLMSGYTWTVSAGGTITAGAGTNTILVSWNTAGAQSVSVNYVNANLCTAASPTVKAVTVNILPIPTVTGNIAACQNSTGNTYTTEAGMSNYLWTVSAGGTITAGGGVNNNMVIVTWNTVGPQTVSVNYTNSNGCTAAAPIVHAVTVNALPVPTIAGPSPVCVGVTGNLYTTEAGMTNYLWSVSPGGTITAGGGTTSNTVTITWNSSGIRTVSVNYTNVAGCTAAVPTVYNVTANPLPVAILSGGETICPANSSILKINITGGTGPFDVDIENLPLPTLNIPAYASDANIVVTPAVTTTYRVLRVRDINGCEVTGVPYISPTTATVTVRALPAITGQPVSDTKCEYSAVTFNVTATGTNPTYQWYVDENNGNGFVPLNDTAVYFGSATPTLNLFGVIRRMSGYRYQVRVTGCATTVTSANASLTVDTPPEIQTQPKDSTICLNAGATFSVIANGTALNYQWQVKVGAAPFANVAGVNFSGATTPTLTIVNAPAGFGNNIFRVVITGTCPSPVISNFVVLRVNLPPVATVNPGNQKICDGAPGPVYFIGNGNGMIDSLRWQVFSGGIWSDVHDNAFYGGATTQQLSVTGVPLSYNGNLYRLALMAACTTTYTGTATLTVNANPVVDFTAVDPILACAGVAKPLNGNPIGGVAPLSHRWTGDIGPLSSFTSQTPNFTSALAGAYKLNYKVTDFNGCIAEDSVTVNVDAPSALFTSDVIDGCTPQTVIFTKNMAGIAKYWWNFDDGSDLDSLSPSPVAHTFTNISATSVSYYDVNLKVKSAAGCFANYTSSITVYPAIDATFTANTIVVCSGKPIVFTSNPLAFTYFWEFGDGVSGNASNVTSHTYTNFTALPRVDTVKLTTTSFYTCTDKKKITITVMPVPAPQFTVAPASPITWPAATYNFTNTTPNPLTWTWSWKFGDGATSTSTSPGHTYADIGNYTVTLIASNANCSDSVKHPVSIIPPAPDADFALIPSGCAPLAMTMNNTSLNTSTPGTTFHWDFGDGGISTSKNPSYTYFTPGDYKVVLTVTGPGGTDSKEQIVHAYESPKAYFEITPPTVYVNDERVRMFNLSQNADNYLWEFGDGDTSKVKDPFHKYMTEGVFDITLHAYSNNGCYNSWTLSPGVTVQPAGVIRFSTVFTPNKTGAIERTDLPTGGTEIDQFFFPPIRETVLNYKLQIFNRWGTLIFESHNINHPWNGYYKGKLCRQGVYVWFVEGKYANGKPFKKAGDVTLLH